uniref:Uncharacterized protein n=1 Tax=Bombyx mori TaxID=7091 RepID=A0A8R2HRY3_BOMMO|nr:uncharacterized protein LOC101740762 isoform X2 [Bombyx mori]
MKTCTIILLVFVSQGLTSKRHTKRNDANVKNCEIIKCPPSDEPVCAKVTQRNKKEIFIVMVNECEMKYMRCHQGIKASIVPMSNCNHQELQKVGSFIRHSNKDTKNRRRDKEGADEEEADEADGEEAEVADVDYKEYDALCPSSCPALNVMVCAECGHGIYRTFLSVCHMRMFRCRHHEENIQLASREPCMMSAPYLSEDVMRPKGRMSKSDDIDTVLKFIYERQRGNSAGHSS